MNITPTRINNPIRAIANVEVISFNLSGVSVDISPASARKMPKNIPITPKMAPVPNVGIGVSSSIKRITPAKKRMMAITGATCAIYCPPKKRMSEKTETRVTIPK